MKRPVIIDCDPGVDDAVAVFMALAAENLDVRAITAVAGNQTLEKTSINALKLVDYAGFDIPVAKGASKPLLRELVTAAHVHGETGLGGIALPEPKRSFSSKNACDTIYEEALRSGQKLLIVALGPLTNIAVTLLKYPDIKERVERIILMGGSCGCGNDTPAAEFNIYADPDAAKIVFESGLPITMVGLDVTHKALIYPEENNEIALFNNGITRIAEKLLDHMIRFCGKHGFPGAVMHDPLAVAYAIDPDVMKTEKYHVDIETKGMYTSGKTVVDIYHVTGKEPNIDVGMDIDRGRFASLFKRLMMSYGA